MLDCIFTAHCTEQTCDKSCPKFVEASYLLERNGIQINNSVYRINNPETISAAMKIIDNADEEHQFTNHAHPVGNFNRMSTVQLADLITYCAICRYWKGSRLHCTVYNLRYSQYLDLIKKSWNGSESEQLQYMRIWAESAKVLVVSNMDFVSFGDFESQTLLNLLQSRQGNQLSTIFVSPEGTEGIKLKATYTRDGTSSYPSFAKMLKDIVQGGKS